MNRDVEILFENEYLLVVNKPCGLATMSTGKGEREVTLYSLLTDYVRSKTKGRGRVWIVHRLDKGTSGVLVFAKDEYTKRLLQDSWNDIVEERKYIALVEGTFDPKEGTLASYLWEEPKSKKVYVWENNPSIEPGTAQGVRAERRGAKWAVTNYKTLAVKGPTSLVEFSLETGRKNQIRVQMSSIGHPIAGDKRYGAKTNPLQRVCLHARSLVFQHPSTGEVMNFQTEIPKAFL